MPNYCSCHSDELQPVSTNCGLQPRQRLDPEHNPRGTKLQSWTLTRHQWAIKASGIGLLCSEPKRASSVIGFEPPSGRPVDDAMEVALVSPAPGSGTGSAPTVDESIRRERLVLCVATKAAPATRTILSDKAVARKRCDRCRCFRKPAGRRHAG